MVSARELDVVARLREKLGDIVDTGDAALAGVRTDQSGHLSSGQPLAIVHAKDVQDVQDTMRIASATTTPVVVRGAGTGLAGAAIAGEGEIVLSTRAMNRVLEVRADDLLAVVEPGIINAELNDMLAQYELWWPPDPASRAISTVGGNIATGAGGLLCAKYGVVKDAVLGVDLVLADGRLLALGHRSVKGVTGLDLTSLVVGSEGTLGVVVAATLKLRRTVGGPKATLSARFTDVRDAAAGSAAITALGVVPAIMELLDAHCVSAVDDYLALSPALAPEALLVIHTDGPAAEEEAALVSRVLRDRGARVEVTTDAVESERLLGYRRALHPALLARGPSLIEDVSVPRSALPLMFDEIARIEREFGIVIPTVAHAGDGNLHPNFLLDGPEVSDTIWSAADELFRSAVRLGGTLTGEHGIGVLKRRWLREELGSDQWDLQRQILSVFDPQGILNPGKVFSRDA